MKLNLVRTTLFSITLAVSVNQALASNTSAVLNHPACLKAKQKFDQQLKNRAGGEGDVNSARFDFGFCRAADALVRLDLENILPTVIAEKLKSQARKDQEQKNQMQTINTSGGVIESQTDELNFRLCSFFVNYDNRAEGPRPGNKFLQSAVPDTRDDKVCTPKVMSDLIESYAQVALKVLNGDLVTLLATSESSLYPMTAEHYVSFKKCSSRPTCH